MFKHVSGEIWNGDCLELMKAIPDGSIDMVLCDLPYGTTQNKWDAVIPFEPLWKEYWRVCKPNAAIVLTAAQPFTSALVMSQIDAFKYDWTWRKSKITGVLNAKIMPVRNHEDILVFGKGKLTYNAQDLTIKNSITKQGGNSQNYGERNKSEYVQEFSNWPRSVLDLKSEGKTTHPTQKPVALFEYLIKTYTNPGETVLDNTSGSGTTAVAAHRTGRRSICIERDLGYYLGSCGRIWKEQQA